MNQISNMKIEITINGITRTYDGYYDTLHNIEWNKKVRDFIDDAQEIPEALRSDNK